MCAAPTLLIRADASVYIGTGHIMRMIALGQAWQDAGGRVIFLCAKVTPLLEQRIAHENFELEKQLVVPGGRDDLAVTSAAITRHVLGGQFVAVALDGYHFDADFQLGLSKISCRLMAVDDYGQCDRYSADLILNQNISARVEFYGKRTGGTHLLLGPKFALLRREFLRSSGRARNIPDQANKLLVTLGGADADNLTNKVINALRGSGLEVKVVVGGSNPHLVSLREAAGAVSRGVTSVDLIVDSRQMSELMIWADFAVAAAGSTSWELAFSGLPTLHFILADNQTGNAWEMERQGLGVCLGEHSRFDERRFRDSVERMAADGRLRASFAYRGRELVDGGGAARVVRAFRAKLHDT
jgi:UDP-2,4-diacetamido-2,4,6-trideoxy-beta-L-altropyranose hydrolase